jgi:hypothetical protein
MVEGRKGSAKFFGIVNYSFRVCIMGVAWLVACTLLYLAGQVQ